MLTKEYPQEGEWAGGVIFRRYFGIGGGIRFTAADVEEVQAGINIGAASTVDIVNARASGAVAGDVVEANRVGAGVWELATVVQVRRDGSTDLLYNEDGWLETGVLPCNLRKHTRARAVEDQQTRRASKRRRREALAEEREAVRARREHDLVTSKRELRFKVGREMARPPTVVNDAEGGGDVKPVLEGDDGVEREQKLTATATCELGATTARTNYRVLTWGDCGTNRQEVAHTHTHTHTHAHTRTHTHLSGQGWPKPRQGWDRGYAGTGFAPLCGGRFPRQGCDWIDATISVRRYPPARW